MRPDKLALNHRLAVFEQHLDNLAHVRLQLVECGRLRMRPTVQAGLLLLFFPVAWLMSRARGYRGFQAYALDRHRGWGRNLALALLIALLAKFAATTVGLRLGVYATEASSHVSPPPLTALLGIVFVTFWPSIAEDIVTRGFWYRQVTALGRSVGFVLVTAVLYVLNHITAHSNG